MLESLKDRPAKKEDTGKKVYNLDGKEQTLKGFNPVIDCFSTEFHTVRKDSPDWFWSNPLKELE